MADQYFGTFQNAGNWNPNYEYNYINNQLLTVVTDQNNTWITKNPPPLGINPANDLNAWQKLAITNLTLTPKETTTSITNIVDKGLNNYEISVDVKNIAPSIPSATIPVSLLGGNTATNLSTNGSIPFGVGANLEPLPALAIVMNAIGGAPIGIPTTFVNSGTTNKTYQAQLIFYCFCTNNANSTATSNITIGSTAVGVKSFKIWQAQINNNNFSQSETDNYSTFTVKNEGINKITLTLTNPVIQLNVGVEKQILLQMRSWFCSDNNNTYSLINNVTLNLIEV